MNWRLPHDWKVPGKITGECLPDEELYLIKKREGVLYSESGLNFELVLNHRTGSRVAIDIGAHIGTNAIRYAKHFDTVHAFEPVYYGLLEANTKHLENVVVHPFAASDKVGALIMRKSRRNSGATVVKTKANKHLLGKTTGSYKRWSQEDISVSCVTVDSFCLTDVDFIKMDTEGYVLAILRGMANTLKNSSPVLMIEFNEMSFDTRECITLLGGLGYSQFKKCDVDHYFERCL